MTARICVETARSGARVIGDLSLRARAGVCHRAPVGVVSLWSVLTFACLYHWYTSAMFVVPVVAVGGWCWWSSKRMTKRQQSRQA
jgi:hypothetical protein